MSHAYDLNMSSIFQDAGALVIDEPRKIRGLRAPIRQEILDAVQSGGACSVAELASRLNRAPDALYYHLHALIKLGLLVRLDPEFGPGAMRIDVPGRPVSIQYRPDSRAQTKALCELVGSMLRIAERDFGSGISSPKAVVDGPGRNIWAARVQARLKQDEAERLHAALQDAQAILSSAAGRSSQSEGDMVALTFVLTPLCPRTRTSGPSDGTDTGGSSS